MPLNNLLFVMGYLTPRSRCQGRAPDTVRFAVCAGACFAVLPLSTCRISSHAHPLALYFAAGMQQMQSWASPGPSPRYPPTSYTNPDTRARMRALRRALRVLRRGTPFGPRTICTAIHRGVNLESVPI
ncbi:hypothetical protein C8R44DRAFT_226168 [Mycena epipterygia]|nr:hypothetical protein C8R44DRAFT_226168 [Mycena epipterygia]